MGFSKLLCRAIMAAAVLAAEAPPLAAQISRTAPHAPEVDELVQDLERGITGRLSRAFGPTYVNERGRRILGAIDRYTDEERRELLDEIERIASSGMKPGRDAAIRFLGLIYRFGEPKISQRWADEGPTRLLRVYRRTDPRDTSQRTRMLAHFAVLITMTPPPPEAPEMLEHLERAALEDTHLNQHSLIRTLTTACEQGRQILWRMYEEGAVRNRMVRLELQDILERDDIWQWLSEGGRWGEACP